MIRKIGLGFGFSLAVATTTSHIFFGFHRVLLILWALSIVSVGIGLWSRADFQIQFNIKREASMILAVMLLVTPLYIAPLFFQGKLHSDEIAQVQSQKELFEKKDSNLFSVGRYFHFPHITLYSSSWLASLIGEVSVHNVRTTHIIMGIFSVGISYALFRLFVPLPQSLGASLIFGTSHVFIGLSNTALLHTSVVFFELLALFFIFAGLKKKSNLLIYLGGTFSGLAFLTFFPGRFVFIMLSFFFILTYLVTKNKKTTLHQYSILLLGFFILAAPPLSGIILKSSDFTLAGPNHASDYVLHQSLLFSQGRDMQKLYSVSDSNSEGVMKNIVRGLTMFNLPLQSMPDHYRNEGYGFVDIVTGMLLWIGILVIWFYGSREEKLFFIANFLIFWFIFTFIINGAPAYSRMLVLLPFIAFFAMKGIHWIATKAKRKVLAPIFVLLIITLNVSAVVDHINSPIHTDLYNATEYMKDHADVSSIIITNATHPYFQRFSGLDSSGLFKTFFRGYTQRIEVKPLMEPAENYKRPLIIYVREDVWTQKVIQTNVSIYYITADRLAVHLS